MEMNDYEKRELLKIKDWEEREPSVVAQAVNLVAEPIGKIVNLVIPQKAILGALTTFNDLAGFFTDENDIIRDGSVSTIEELQKKDLQLSDKLATNVTLWAKGIAGTEGAASGAAGIFGMAVDIPTIITLALRTIQKIALCYGYKCNTEAEKIFVFQVMSSASSNSMKEKIVAITALKQIQLAIAKNTWKKLAEQAAQKQAIPTFVMCIKALAKQLGINITKRKALQVIPVAGGLVGAAMNVAYISDIAEAAMRVYQKRWLEENEKIIES